MAVYLNKYRATMETRPENVYKGGPSTVYLLPKSYQKMQTVVQFPVTVTLLSQWTERSNCEPDNSFLS